MAGPCRGVVLSCIAPELLQVGGRVGQVLEVPRRVWHACARAGVADVFFIRRRNGRLAQLARVGEAERCHSVLRRAELVGCCALSAARAAVCFDVDEHATRAAARSLELATLAQTQ